MATAAIIAAARVLSLDEITAWTLLGVTTVLALSSSASWVTTVAGTALVWALGTGFETHRLGELAFGPPDRGHLLVVGSAAAVALTVRAVSRRAVREAAHPDQP